MQCTPRCSAKLTETGSLQAADFGLIQLSASYQSWFGYSWDATDDGGLVVNTAGYPGELSAAFYNLYLVAACAGQQSCISRSARKMVCYLGLLLQTVAGPR